MESLRSPYSVALGEGKYMNCTKHLNRREWHEKTGVCTECAGEHGSKKFSAQLGQCAICEKSLGERTAKGNVPSAAQLDHDHSTGQLRGVLCRNCNMALGLFGDDPRLVEAAEKYLKYWKAKL